MSVEDEIKEFALKSGATVAGIASAEEIEQYAPPGHRPSDFLRGAKSVVVSGFAPNPSVWRCNRLEMGLIGHITARSLPAALLVKACEYIQRRHGEHAVPAPSGSSSRNIAALSLKLCAELAGLGRRSLAAGILLNPKYGLLYFQGVITTMDLKADGRTEERVCPDPSCVTLWSREGATPCLRACPSCLSGEIEDGGVKWYEYRQDRCSPSAQPVLASFHRSLLDLVNEEDPARREMIAYGSTLSQAVYQIAMNSSIVGQCFECTRVCPIVLRGSANLLREMRDTL